MVEMVEGFEAERTIMRLERDILTLRKMLDALAPPLAQDMDNHIRALGMLGANDAASAFGRLRCAFALMIHALQTIRAADPGPQSDQSLAVEMAAIARQAVEAWGK